MDGTVLPIEVCELIINQLYRDKGTLWACCLVCRAWLPRSRCNLYGSISIDNTKSLDLFHRRIILDPEARKYLSNARELYLLGQHYGGFKARKTRSEFIFRALLPLSAGLGPTVTYLEIQSGSWIRTPTMYSPPMQLTQFISVAELALNRCRFGTFSEIQRLIQALPSLVRIHLQEIWCRKLSITANGHRTRYSNRPRLSTLDIRRCSRDFCHAMFSWLSLTESTQTLSVLEANNLFGYPEGGISINHSSLGSLLGQIGLSLKCLHVDWLLRQDFMMSGSMARLHSLRSLHTSVNMSSQFHEVRRLAKILSEAAFNKLQVIDLVVDIGKISADIDLSQWKDVDDLCNMQKLPALRKFSIKLIWSDSPWNHNKAVKNGRVEHKVSELRNQLSGIHKRGALLVTCTERRIGRMTAFRKHLVRTIWRRLNRRARLQVTA